MTTIRAAIRIAVATSLAAAFVALAGPAAADPDKPKVSRVFELPCAGPVCEAGEDPSVSSGGVVGDSVQIHVSASSPIGLRFVRLDGRLSGDSWTCLNYWGTSSSSFTDYDNWNTNQWPGDPGDPPAGCDESSRHGDRTRNGVYELRVVAGDATGTTTSDIFTLKISNGAETPEWVSEPSSYGERDREPVVVLKWKANPEPDVREYHFIRSGPEGEREFAVSASRPGGQGCKLDGDVYICEDSEFSTYGFEGDYDYSLVAMRASPSSRTSCSLSPYGDCVESQASDQRSIALSEPPRPTPAQSRSTPPNDDSSGDDRPDRAPAPVDGSRPPRSPGDGGSLADFYSGDYETNLPYDDPGSSELPGGDGRTPVAVGPDGEPIYDIDTSGRRRAMQVLAGGMLMLLGSAHLARFLKAAPVE